MLRFYHPFNLKCLNQTMSKNIRKRLFSEAKQKKNDNDESSSEESTEKNEIASLNTVVSSSETSEESTTKERFKPLRQPSPEWASSWEMQGWRGTMEDRQLIIENVAGEPSVAVVAIFDGHGGEFAAEIAKQNFRLLFAKHYINIVKDRTCPELGEFEKVMILTFAELHMLIVADSDSGCTALVTLVTETRFFVANLGNSRAVAFYKDGSASLITTDHVASNPDEEKQIVSRGSFVVGGRVAGDLMVSRALGDIGIASYISRLPDVFERPRDCIQYLLMSCGGLWERMDVPTVTKICNQKKKFHETAKTLIKSAFDAGSKDNISLILIQI